MVQASFRRVFGPRLVVGLAGFVWALCLASFAAEPLRRLFVAPDGDDGSDGLAWERALRSIGAAARRTKPGDCVLIRGGTYREHVRLDRAGSAEHPIVFRAVPGETVWLTFGERPKGWRKAAGTRFTYAVSYPRLPNDVWEDRGGTRYVAVSDALTLERMPGAYLYDTAARILNVHPLHGSAPEEAGIVVAMHSDYSLGRTTGSIKPQLQSWFVRATHLWDKGVELAAPHNRVEGFVISHFPIGIHIAADYCEARENTIYGCREGIYAYSGDKSVVANNRCVRNYAHGIIVQTTNDVVVCGNFCLKNEPTGAAFQGHTKGKTGNCHNLALYGGDLPGEVSFIGNTVVAESHDHVLRIKNSAGRIIMTHNVLVGGNGKVHFPGKALGGRGADYSSNTVIGGVLRDRHSKEHKAVGPDHCPGGRSRAKAPLYLGKDVRTADGFADPVRHDYRLRADSPHVGKGALPRPAPLRYVSIRGDDAADGRTPATAWRTIGKAAATAGPGETVYVLAGSYRETVRLSRSGTAGAPLAFRSHGRGRVVLDGDGQRDYGIVLSGVRHVVIDGLTFTGFVRSAVGIRNGFDLELTENMIGPGAGKGVVVAGGGRIALRNNTFGGSRVGIEVRELIAGLTLRNNLFARGGGQPVLVDSASCAHVVSERNAFSCGGQWLREWRGRVRETHPSLIVDVVLSGPDFRLPAGSPLAFGGLAREPIGATRATKDGAPVVIEEFRVASASPRSAIVAWQTPFDYPDATLKWTRADGTKESRAIPQDRTLKTTRNAARLWGLRAGVACEALLEVRTRDGRTGAAPLAIRLPGSGRAPTTLYVAPNGGSEGPGRSRLQPFGSLASAALAAAPGDTVLVAPGVYAETLTIWTSGISSSRPLTFRSARPGAAVIHCGALRSVAIRASDVKHVVIDGFRIEGDIREAVNIQNCGDVLFCNNTLPFSVGTRAKLRAYGCRGLVLSNNLFASGWTSIRAQNCDNVRIEQNTVSHGGINPVWLDGAPDASYRIVNNIFFGRMHRAKDNPALTVKPTDNLVCDHNLYWQDPTGKGGVALFNDWGGRGNYGRKNARTIQEAIDRYGVERHGRLANPRFVDRRKNDFRLRPESPALGMGANGVTVGWRGSGSE